MSNEQSPVPRWVPGACIGIAIAIGALSTGHMPSDIWFVRLLLGAVVAGVAVLGLLYLAQAIFKRR